MSNGEYLINDKVFARPAVASRVLKEFRELAVYGQEAAPIFAPLSPREVEILDNIAKGMTNKQVAYALSISEQTVKNHMSSILRKLSVNDRTQAVVYAMKQGWVEDSGGLTTPEEPGTPPPGRRFTGRLASRRARPPRSTRPSTWSIERTRVTPGIRGSIVRARWAGGRSGCRAASRATAHRTASGTTDRTASGTAIRHRAVPRTAHRPRAGGHAGADARWPTTRRIRSGCASRSPALASADPPTAGPTARRRPPGPSG